MGTPAIPTLRVLHFADVHLGVENYGRLDVATGLHSRLLDFMRSFDELVEYALAERVDLVLFAGDAYRTRDPSPTHQREFAKRIHRLASADIPVFLLAGNHDIPSTVGRANTLDIFGTLEVPNVHVGRKPGTHRIQTRSGPLQIVALPWMTRSHLLAREEHKNRSLAEIDELTLIRVEHILEAQVKELDPDVPTILTFHGAVFGALYGSERSVMLGQELVLPKSLLAQPSFDYVALGHIHKHQTLHADPAIVYSGSLDRIDFGEEKEAKGFVVADVARGQAKFRFVELHSTRRFVTIEVEADGEDPMSQVSAAIMTHDIRDAIVRLVIHVPEETNHLVRDDEVHRLLGEAFKVATLVRDVKRRSRWRLGPSENIARLTPLELLERYLQTRQVEGERLDTLLRYARLLMNWEGPLGTD